MRKRKKVVKKPSVESRLRSQIKELKKANATLEVVVKNEFFQESVLVGSADMSTPDIAVAIMRRLAKELADAHKSAPGALTTPFGG